MEEATLTHVPHYLPKGARTLYRSTRYENIVEYGHYEPAFPGGIRGDRDHYVDTNRAIAIQFRTYQGEKFEVKINFVDHTGRRVLFNIDQKRIDELINSGLMVEVKE